MKPIRTVALISGGCLLATLLLMAGPMSGFRTETFQSGLRFWWFLPLIATAVAAISATAMIVLRRQSAERAPDFSTYRRLGMMSSALAYAAVATTLYALFYREWFGWSAEALAVLVPASLIGLLFALAIGFLLGLVAMLANKPSNRPMQPTAGSGG